MVDEALKLAIKKAGGMAALARELGIARQAICQWHRTPVLRVIDIERITGVSRSQLRPDVYPPERVTS